MNEFTTVFEITSGTNGIRADAMFRFAVGALVLIAGMGSYIRHKRTDGRFSLKLIAPALMIVWSIMWLVMHFPVFGIATSDINHLLDIYKSGKSQVVEGVVHVSHEQPYQGHSSGDRITVGGQEFEVDYFHVTPGYSQSISHGGALRGGVFARLHHHNGVILKAEVATKKPGQ